MMDNIMDEGEMKHLSASGMMGKKLKVEYDGGSYKLALPEKGNIEMFEFKKLQSLKTIL